MLLLIWKRPLYAKNLSYTLVIRLACGIITILTALLAFGGQMGIAKAAVLLIATFVLYQPLENLGNISAMVRMMEVSLKRIEKMKRCRLWKEKINAASI